MTESHTPLTPEQFFDEVVPQVMRATVGQREGLTGRCEVHLFGHTPAGWTIDLSEGTVVRGGTAKPDLYLEMDRSDFEALMLNQLDLEDAVNGGRVRYQGSLPLLLSFAGLLEPKAVEN